MELQGKAKLLKIYVGESDKINGRPLFEELVYAARKEGLAGATVYRGTMSYGASHSIHTVKIFALSGDLPMVIEIVDAAEKVKNFVTIANQLIDKSGKGGMIMMQDAEVVRYSRGEKYR